MPTVDRVLPWRRNHQPPADEVAPLLNSFRQRHPKAPTALITRAYLESADAHSGQSRDSGEPYVQHPLAVARIVSDLGLDDVLATGGTAAATCRLVERLGGVIAGLAFVVELGFLDGRAKLPKQLDVLTLITV